MATVQGTISGIAGSFGTSVTMLMVIGVALLLAVAVAGGLWYFAWHKRRWFLKVEFKIPRSDGRFLSAEWGKGFWDTKKGVVWLKRKGKPKVPMKAFDAKKYLQGTNFLTVIQISTNTYVPIMPKSFIILENDRTGQEISVLKMTADFSESKSWKEALERKLKSTYSIQSFIQQFQTYIAMGMVALFIFVGFAIIWQRLPTICK